MIVVLLNSYRSPGPFCLAEVYPVQPVLQAVTGPRAACPSRRPVHPHGTGRAIGIRDGAAQFGADRPVNGPAMSARSAAILNAIGSAAGALKRVSSVAAGASCADRPAPGPRAWPVACILRRVHRNAHIQMISTDAYSTQKSRLIVGHTAPHLRSLSHVGIGHALV